MVIDMSKKMLLYIFLFTFIDQISKNLVNLYMNLNQSISIINNFFSLTYVQNEGAAFSILSGHRLLFIILTIIALNIIYLYIKDLKTKFENIIYSLLIGGIIGNLIDRVLYGYVIDFLDFKFLGYNFAIFNLADSFIVISVLLLLIKSLGDKYGTHCFKRK